MVGTIYHRGSNVWLFLFAIQNQVDRFTFVPSAIVSVNVAQGEDDYIVQPEDSNGDGQSDEISIVSLCVSLYNSSLHQWKYSFGHTHK